MNTNDLLGDRKENLKKVLQVFNKTLREHDEDVEILKEWIKTQPHLPSAPKDELISNTLIRCKFSIEKSKTTLDMYYTIRALMPDIFDRSSKTLDELLKVFDNQDNFFPLHRLTKEGYRITLSKHFSEPTEYDPYKTLNLRSAIFEIRYIEDCVAGDIFIEDLSCFKFGHLKKLTPVVVKKAVNIYETVFNNNIKGIYCINTPSYFESLFNLVKRLMKPKLAARLHCYSNDEILREVIPMDLLPVDYGGKGPSMNDLKDMWKKKFHEFRPTLLELDKLRTEEIKRPTPLINDEILGYYGNFKKINID